MQIILDWFGFFYIPMHFHERSGPSIKMSRCPICFENSFNIVFFTLLHNIPYILHQ